MTDKPLRTPRERDRMLIQELLARLARIKSAGAARHTRELREKWSEDNIIEVLYLKKAKDDGTGWDERTSRHG